MNDPIPSANVPDAPSKGKADPHKISPRKGKGADPFSAGFLALLSLPGMQRSPGSGPPAGRGNPKAAPPGTSPRKPTGSPADGRSAPLPRGKNRTAPAGTPATKKAPGPAPEMPLPPEAAGLPEPAGGRKEAPREGRPIDAHPASPKSRAADVPPAKAPKPQGPPSDMPDPERVRPSRVAASAPRHPIPAAAPDREAASTAAGPTHRSPHTPPPGGTAGAGGETRDRKPGSGRRDPGRGFAPGPGREAERSKERFPREAALVPPAGKATTPAPSEAAGPRPSAPPRFDPPDLPPLADQFVARLSPLPDGSHRVELRLVPDHLGTLKIDLRIHHGTMDARLQVESPEARAALLRDESALRQALLSGGITLSSYTVSVVAGGGAMDRGSFPAGRGGERRPSGEEGGERHRSAGSEEGAASPVDPALSATHWIA
ncbi:MAG: hypothetical protein Kow00128_00610 [Deltaproteobacteria bacterium]